MKTRFCLVLLLFALAAAALRAGEFSFSCRTDKSPLEYALGEKMTFTLRLLEDGEPLPGKKLVWTRTGDDGRKESGEASSDSPLVIETSIDRPGFVRIKVDPFDADGKPLMRGRDKFGFDGGAGAAVGQIGGGEIPEDFDAFWAAQKEELAKIPLKVLEMKEVDSGDPAVKCYDLKIACAGGMPVSGYLCMPKNAEPKSLKAELLFRGYAVVGASRPVKQGKERIAFQINAHGIENGRPESYYNELKNGKLRAYGFRDDENRERETTYFRGMVLRLLRALEYLKSLPEWDGKTLAVSGGSQGGFQALAAAALDPDVTQCFAGIPWLCDLSGITRGRLRGWRPNYAPGLDYIDSAFFGTRIKCPVTIEAGLGDYVCPPSGVAALYNGISAPKKIVWKQGRTHAYSPRNAETFVQEAE